MTETSQSAASAATLTEVRTFLIADVRGYTEYTVRQGDEAAARLTTRFAEVTEEAITARGGRLLELRGDEALVVFASARQALRCALELQQRFRTEPDLPLRVGIGLDAGEAIPVGDGFRGAALNLAARLCSLAGPGEVLASDTVTNLARKVDGIEYGDRGTVTLKGFDEPVRVVAVLPGSASGRDGTVSIGVVTGHDGWVRADEGMTDARLPIGGFLGSLPSGTLVGRDAELERLLSAVAAAGGRGEGRTVLLAGEPGAGKTRLGQEATLALRDADCLIAAGRCYEPEQTVPYYPFLDVMAAIYEGAPAEVRQEARTRWPHLAALLPEALPVPEAAAGGQDEQQRVFRAVTGFLQRVAERRPIAVLLDDLHWADAASLKLLQHLSFHTRTSRVLLLGTYRDVEVGRQHPLEGMLSDLNRAGVVERIEVRRLPMEGTRALVASTMGEEDISEEFAQLIYTRTEGNPYFVQQVLRVMVERGDVFRRDGVWDRKDIAEIDVPESIRAVVGQRLSRLPEASQEVLSEASVLGQTFRFDDLLGLGDLSERDVERALDEASEAGLVREVAADSYGFDHALTQQSLYGELSARRKRRLHRAAGNAIERLPERKREGRTAEIAWHFLQADEPDRALPWTMAAGEAAARVFAHSEAELQFRTAVELARELGDAAREAEGLEHLGEALRVAGRYGEALEPLEGAAALYARMGDRERELRVIANIGRTHARGGTSEEGLRRVLPVLQDVERAGVESIPLQIAAALYVAVAHLYFAVGEQRELLSAAARAAELAEAAGDKRVLAEALNRKGTALTALGSMDEAREACLRASELGEECGDLQTAASAFNNVALTYQSEARFEEGERWSRRGLEVAERLGDPGLLAFCQMGLGSVLERRGRWDEARRLYEEAWKTVRTVDASWMTPYPLAALGNLQMLQGEREEGIAHIEEALELAERNGDLQALYFLFGRAMQHIQDGEPEVAVARLEPFLERVARHGRPDYSPLLAWAYFESGNAERAGETLALAREQAREDDNLPKLGEAHWISAIIAVRQGRWDDAGRDLDAVFALLQRVGELPYERAQIRLTQAEMLAGRGDQDAARKTYEEALETFRRLGAQSAAQRAEKLLRALEES